MKFVCIENMWVKVQRLRPFYIRQVPLFHTISYPINTVCYRWYEYMFICATRYSRLDLYSKFLKLLSPASEWVNTDMNMVRSTHFFRILLCEVSVFSISQDKIARNFQRIHTRIFWISAEQRIPKLYRRRTRLFFILWQAAARFGPHLFGHIFACVFDHI